MQYQFDDVQQAVEALPGLKLDYRQLASGPAQFCIGVHPIGEVMSSKAYASTLIEGTGSVQPGQVLFLLCTGGFENRYGHLLLSDGQVYLQDDAAPPSYQLLKAGYSSALFNLPTRLLEDHLGRPLAAGLGQGSVLSLPLAARQCILELLREARLPQAPNQRHLGDLIAQAFCRGLNLPSLEPAPFKPDSKARLARAIRDRLENCPEMTLGDICGSLSVSERTLRRVFSEYYSVSPGQYQLAVKLNAVREQLRSRIPSKGSICEIAAAQGFWHMGRFGAQYRRHFGETPTQTLQAPGPKCFALGLPALAGCRSAATLSQTPWAGKH